ncbi:MAG: hypothetical protein ABWU19_11340, partial [Meiothermus cerbereus]
MRKRTFTLWLPARQIALKWAMALLVILLAACITGSQYTPLNPRPDTSYGLFSLPSGPTYYVGPGGSNTNDGSRERPWASLAYAVQRLKPGDVLRVLPGNYHGSVQVTVSGTASQRITIASESRWGAKLNAQGALFGIDVRGSYVDIVGFEVTGASNSGIISWA